MALAILALLSTQTSIRSSPSAAAPLPLQRKPAGDRGIHDHALAVLELGHLPKRIGQVAVVEHQQVRKLLNLTSQILQRALETGRQLTVRHNVPALHKSHLESLHRA